MVRPGVRSGPVRKNPLDYSTSDEESPPGSPKVQDIPPPSEDVIVYADRPKDQITGGNVVTPSTLETNTQDLPHSSAGEGTTDAGDVEVNEGVPAM